ncbi:hypothetical protein B7494_g2404 [Chlorociboria aeruginascens]|nr:hypothetical protein B7494_g2404 [Chlorociboria aeruginascens]
MAANKTLDPSTCTTAQEAFKYPLPQIRQYHRNLTIELDEKNARLRTLVGGSYRQLLGTAETILQMRIDIEDVEEKLARVGKGCGRSVIGGMIAGLGKLQSQREGIREELGWTARMKILEMCGISVGRLLRRGGGADGEKGRRGKGLVLAAKVLVLSRLLVKSLSDPVNDGKEEKEAVEEARRKLGTSRRRLLRAIERTLEKASGDGDKEDLVQALCAYSLATSSGAKDVLRHLLHVRGEAMTLTFDAEVGEKQEMSRIIKALELYTRTLLDVQALTPRRLSEALASLKIKPLLKDEGIRDLEGLRLDVCERWFGDEISFFTPYVRHDDLDGTQAADILKGWAKKASQVLLEGLTKSMQKSTEFKTVVELRTNILEVWIKEGGKARGFDPSVLLNGLRVVINDRMVQLLQSRVGKLHLVGTEIEATLGSWRDGTTDKYESLWQEDMLGMDISSGGKHFKQEILARTYGRNDAVSRALKGYQTWLHLIDEMATILEQLKKQRWNDDLEGIEDDLSLESRNTLLSQEDPQMLQSRLDSKLDEAFKELDDKIFTLFSTYEESEYVGKISIYLLRVLRDIRTHLPKNASLQQFGLAIVPSLHKQLASTVSTNLTESFAKSFKRKRVVGRALWEGTPELPVQPSPSTFKFLHSLTLSMSHVGADLWSPIALGVLKAHLRAELGQKWATVLNINDTNGSNGANGEGAQNEFIIQALFDILVLQVSLEHPSPSGDDRLETLGKKLGRHLELESLSQKRLQQAAKEYWKRTGLLFGLLTT